MKKQDSNFAAIMFCIFLLPTIFVCFMAIGNIIYLAMAFTGMLSGSAAAGGGFAVILSAIFIPLAIGLVQIEKDLIRRMRATGKSQDQ